jgi:hypothetical protein
MLRTLASALLLAYVPGALIFRLPLAQREYRAALPADERAFWAVILSVLWSLVLVLALAGAGRYRFEYLLIINAAISIVMAAWWRARLSYHGLAPAIAWTSLAPIAIACLGLWLYFPPSEYVIGGKDPGTYMNEGVQIAQGGTLVIHDPVVASVPEPTRDLFFPSHDVPWYYGVRFMGFFIDDPGTGTVIGQFPHLFPASIAVGYGLNGLSGARQSVGAWAILGLVTIYFVGTRLFGRLGGAIAAGLLAVNVVEVWFARYPNSELAMQTLVFAAVLALAHARAGSRTFFGALAGALLGLQLFLRFDVIPAIAAFSAAAAIGALTRERVGWAFGVALAVTGGAGLWYLAVLMRVYSARLFAYTANLGGWTLIVLGTVAFLIFRLLIRWIARSERRAAAVRRAVPIGLAAAVVGLAIYAYFFRQAGGRLAEADAMAFRTFAWYLTPWGVAAAVAGLALLVTRSFWREPALLLTIITYAIFLFYKTRIVPVHFWSARRMLAVILPGAVLCIAGLLVTSLNPRALGALPPFRRAGAAPWLGFVCGALAVAVAAPLAAAFLKASTPIRHHVEYAGLIPRLEQLAGRIGDRDLLIVESRSASDVHVLAVPLAYIYARNVLVLNTPVPPKAQLETFVTWARSRYSEILFLGGGGTDLLTRRLSAESISSDRFQVPEYDAPLNAYPSIVRHKEFDFGLYKLVPRVQAPAGPITLTIGMGDDLHVVRFHAKEVRPGAGFAYRWTRDVSYVMLLGMGADARQVTVWMSTGGRPSSEAPPRVEVSLEERVLGTATPVDDVRPYTFEIPADAAASAAARDDPVRLRLRVPTWNPSVALDAPDSRDLGVIVTGVEVR